MKLRWDSMLEMDTLHSHFQMHSLNKLAALINVLMLEIQESLYIVSMVSCYENSNYCEKKIL